MESVTKEFNYSLLKSCGKDVIISANVEIKRPQLVSVGNHVAIDSGFYCTVKAEIGDYIHIAPYVTAIGGEPGVLRMGHFTTIAAGSRLICVSDDYSGEGLIGPLMPEGIRGKRTIAPIVLENFAGIATNSVVLPGVKLAEGSILGACSMLTHDTEPWTIYMGVPARPILPRKKDCKEKAKQLGYDL